MRLDSKEKPTENIFFPTFKFKKIVDKDWEES
jgi:hypothetical protein